MTKIDPKELRAVVRHMPNRTRVAYWPDWPEFVHTELGTVWMSRHPVTGDVFVCVVRR